MNSSSETKFPAANGDREINNFPFQLTMSKFGNHSWLIHILLEALTTLEVHKFKDNIAIAKSEARAGER